MVYRTACVVSLVGEKGIKLDFFQKRLGLSDVGVLTLCDIEVHRVPKRIAGDMDVVVRPLWDRSMA